MGVLALLATLLSFWVQKSGVGQASFSGGSRLASLAPCITSSLIALGGEDRLALISDYCPQVADLPRGGTALSPDLERVKRSGATVVLARAAGGVPVDSIGRVGQPVVLPWSNVDEMCESIQRLGELSGTEMAARQLVEDLKDGLKSRESADMPEVLLVIGGPLDRSGGPWVIRSDSLHGQALKAAGYRNALKDQRLGAPQLSIEALVEMDPSVIIHLVPAEGDELVDQAVRDSYSGIPGLNAWKEKRIGAIQDPAILDEGPGLLTLVEQLRREIELLTGNKVEASR